MKEEPDVFESRELMEAHFRRRKRRKRIFAFVMAVAILLTFAVPIGMMMPVSTQQPREKDSRIPVYDVTVKL